MREILFRAKRLDNGKWIEGYYAEFKQLPNSCIYHVYKGHTLVDDVDPETVCQYTGLTDKNGKKIFEGDILSGKKYNDWGQGGEYEPDLCILEWNEERAAFAPVYWWKGYNHDLKDYEVIGNIFDNPELIDTAGI